MKKTKWFFTLTVILIGLSFLGIFLNSVLRNKEGGYPFSSEFQGIQLRYNWDIKHYPLIDANGLVVRGILKNVSSEEKFVQSFQYEEVLVSKDGRSVYFGPLYYIIEKSLKPGESHPLPLLIGYSFTNEKLQKMGVGPYTTRGDIESFKIRIIAIRFR